MSTEAGKDPGDPRVEIARMLPDGSAYVLQDDPEYPGLLRLVVRSPGVPGTPPGAPSGSGPGEGVARLGRDHLRVLISDVTIAGKLRQTPPAIERSARAVMLAGAMRRNLELVGELWAQDPVAAEVLLKAVLDHVKSLQPSLTSGALGS